MHVYLPCAFSMFSHSCMSFHTCHRLVPGLYCRTPACDDVTSRDSLTNNCNTEN